MLDDTLNLSAINDQVIIPKKGKKSKDHLSIEQLLHKIDKQEESETQVKKIKLHHQKSSSTVKPVFPEENHHPPLIKLANLVLQERSPSKTSRLNHYPDLNSDLSPEALYQIHPPPVIKLQGLSRGSFGEERTFSSASHPRFSNLNPSNSDFNNHNFIQTPMGQLLPRISRVHHDHSPSLLVGGDGTNRSSYNNLPGSFQSRILKLAEGDSSPENHQMMRLNVNSERIRHSSLQRNMSMKLNLPKILPQEGNIHSSSGLATVTPNRQHAYLNYQDSPQTRQDRMIHHRRTDRDGVYQSADMSTGTRSSTKIPSTRKQFDFVQAPQHVDLSTERGPSSPMLLPSNLGIESPLRPAFHRKSMTREFTNTLENGNTRTESSFKLERHLSDQQPKNIDNQHLDDRTRLLRTSIFRKIAQNAVLKTQPN